VGHQEGLEQTGGQQEAQARVVLRLNQEGLILDLLPEVQQVVQEEAVEVRGLHAHPVRRRVRRVPLLLRPFQFRLQRAVGLEYTILDRL
jgi:hypothetical protein